MKYEKLIFLIISSPWGDVSDFRVQRYYCYRTQPKKMTFFSQNHRIILTTIKRGKQKSSEILAYPEEMYYLCEG